MNILTNILLVVLCFVTRYLKHVVQDATMCAKAQAVIKECEEKNKNENGGELEWKSLAVSLKAQLQETVGETYWRIVQDHLSRYWERQVQQVQGGVTTGVAAAAGSSGGEGKKSLKKALLLSTNTAPDGLPGGWVSKTFQQIPTNIRRYRGYDGQILLFSSTGKEIPFYEGMQGLPRDLKRTRN